MTTVIVDTNVALVANGSCEGVSAKCRLASIDFLEKLLHSGKLAVDFEGEIESEYRKNLGVGNPGVGNRFLQKFFSEAAHRIVRVSTPVNNAGNFKNFKFDGSLKRFDRSDRKFVALAAATGFIIYNATDSDWLEHKVELNNRGIKITFVCGSLQSGWFDL